MRLKIKYDKSSAFLTDFEIGEQVAKDSCEKIEITKQDIISLVFDDLNLDINWSYFQGIFEYLVSVRGIDHKKIELEDYEKYNEFTRESYDVAQIRAVAVVKDEAQSRTEAVVKDEL